MQRATVAGAAALLTAPAVVIAGTLIRPTVSDEAADQVRALADHRGAMITGMALGTIAIVLLLAGCVWLALAVREQAPGLALFGGVLGVAGSLVVLFEDGVAAAAPSLVHGFGSAQATAALDKVQSSAAVAGLEPLSLLGDLGLALLGLAVVKMGASRWTAVLIAVGAFAESAGFATGTKVLVLAGFAVLFVGLVQAVRALVEEPAPLGADVAPSY